MMMDLVHGLPLLEAFAPVAMRERAG